MECRAEIMAANPWIPDRVIVLGAQAADRLDGAMIARRTLAECFSTMPPPPPYGDDGAFRQSLVPIGQLGEYWFLRDDPEAVYVVPFGETIIEGWQDKLTPDYLLARAKRAGQAALAA